MVGFPQKTLLLLLLSLLIPMKLTYLAVDIFSLGILEVDI